jgi:hypothetical protein
LRELLNRWSQIVRWDEPWDVEDHDDDADEASPGGRLVLTAP